MGLVAEARFRRRFGRLLRSWLAFRGALLGVPHNGVIAEEREAEFRDLKADLLESVTVLAVVDSHGSQGAGFALMRDLCGLVEKVPSLGSLAASSIETRESFLGDWEGCQVRLASLARTAHPARGPARSPRAAPSGGLGPAVWSAVGGPRRRGAARRWLTRLVLRVALLAIAAIVILGIWRRPWAPTSTPATAVPPDSASSSGAVSTALRPLLDGAGAAIDGLARKVQPFVAGHETEAAIVLGGFVLLFLAYLALVRRV